MSEAILTLDDLNWPPPSLICLALGKPQAKVMLGSITSSVSTAADHLLGTSAVPDVRVVYTFGYGPWDQQDDILLTGSECIQATSFSAALLIRLTA